MHRISNLEYRRRVFNTALLECFSRLHESCCEFDMTDCHDAHMADVAKKMCNAFFTDKLNLNDCTIGMTKKNLSEATTFIKDCIDISESIACDKADCAAKEDLEMTDEQPIELSPEDQHLIDKLFDEKSPQMQVDEIRDATVKALLEEDKKAQEIRDSLSIAQSQVSAGGNPKVMEETVNRLSNRGPTSLMNAIMNAVATAAVKDVNENSDSPVSVGTVMTENAEEIKNRAMMIYMMYECANKFGIIHYDTKAVKKLSEEIYYNR